MRRAGSTWALLATVALVGQAPAPDLARAEEIVRMPYEVFVALPHEPPFDWSSDGCSVPMGLGGAAVTRFAPACRLHDFGYRNFGRRGLGMAPTEEMRSWIDGRFLAEMVRLCRHGGPSLSCLRTATVWFWAVRRYGGRYF